MIAVRTPMQICAEISELTKAETRLLAVIREAAQNENCRLDILKERLEVHRVSPEAIEFVIQRYIEAKAK